MNTLKDTILERKSAAENYLRTKRDTWTEYENLLHGYLSDDLSSKTKSQMFDPKLPTMALDRSARVMAQLPVGKVKGISKNDAGAEQLMNLILEKYAIPNANAQFDFLTKMRMMNLYSNIYGNFFALVDWDIKANGYIGPDIWLIPIRNVFPQVGAVSLEDSDYIIIRSWKPISYFEGLEDQKGYKNIKEIIKVLKDKSGSKGERPADEKTAREVEEFADETAAKEAGYFEVLSMYERDRWVDFCTDAELPFRDQKNPHENGELPVVNKYSIPLLDDIMGMGDFERGKPMQYGINSLWNLYLDAVKVSIFPPVLIDEDKVSDQSSVKWAAGAKWLMKMGGAVNGAQTLNLTPQGTNTFNQVYGTMNASLLNMFGTSDTSTTTETDPGFGKTPQALKMQANRENARDNVDRFYTERFLTVVMKKFVNLISKKMTGSVAVRLFDEEIEQLKKSYPEVEKMWDDKTGKLSISKSKFGSTLYDYEIVSGSTYATDQAKQQESLISMFGLLSENLQVDQTGTATSPLLMAMAKENKKVMFGEMFTRIISRSGIQDWDKIVVDTKDDIDGKMQEDMTKIQALITQMTAQSGMNQIPTNPVAEGLPPEMTAPQGVPQGQPMPQTEVPYGQ